MSQISLIVICVALIAAPVEAAEKPDVNLNPGRTARALANSDVVARRAAIHQFVDSLDTSAVKEYGDDLLPVIFSSLKDSDPEVRYYGFSAARMLAHAVVLSKQSKDGQIFGRKVTLDFRKEARLEALLRKAASDSDPRIRTCAVSVVAKGYPPTPQNEEFLAKLSETEKHPQVRREIVDGIGVGKYSSKGTERVLTTMLEDKSQEVKGWAGYFLGQMKAKDALPILVSKLDDDRPFVKERILQGIKAYGENARPILPELKKRLAIEKNASARKSIEAVMQSVESNGK